MLFPRRGVEDFPHTVQALELELAAPAELQHRGERVRVVGGELAVELLRVGSRIFFAQTR